MNSSRPPEAINQPAAIIVLGAAQYDGRPSRVLAARLDHAHILATRYPDAMIITVGGKLPGDRFTEAEVSRTYLLNKQDDTNNQSNANKQHNNKQRNPIHAVPEGNDTVESLNAVIAQHPELVAEPRPRTVIVTDPLHVPRTYLLAKQAGLHATVSPTRTCPQRFPQAAWWRYLLHEIGGLIVFAMEKATSPRISRAVATFLHRVEGWIRPSRKVRNQHLSIKNNRWQDNDS